MRDRDGRPLGESKVGPDLMRDVPYQLRTCPYPGSRHKHARPMNSSALKQVSRNWKGILGSIDHLHRLYRARAPSASLRISDVWRIGCMSQALADFAFLRAWRSYADGELPATIGALYKTTLGVTSTGAGIWTDGQAAFTATANAHDLYDYVERYGQLIGPDEVCGGSEAMLKELFEVVIHGATDRSAPGELVDVIGDEHLFHGFCDATSALRLLRFALERMDAALRWQLALELEAHLPRSTQSAVAGDLVHDARLGRFLALPAEEQAGVLEEILGQLEDPRFLPAELLATANTVRDAWSEPAETCATPVEHALDVGGASAHLPPAARQIVTAHAARYVALERAAASAVAQLKARIAEQLGVAPDGEFARARGLLDFVPTSPSRPSMRHALRYTFGIGVSAPRCQVVVAPVRG